MKKIKKSKSKISKFKSNPPITGYEQIKKHIDTLIGQDVVLHVRDFSIPHTPLRKSHQKRIPIYGVLGGIIIISYLFYFNPLNQWKYQEISKEQKKELSKQIPSEYNEEMAIMEDELEFMNNEPTMKLKFMISDINYIEDNQFYFHFTYNPIPTLIGTT